jgi:hypothetical protein
MLNLLCLCDKCKFLFQPELVQEYGGSKARVLFEKHVLEIMLAVTLLFLVSVIFKMHMLKKLSGALALR